MIRPNPLRLSDLEQRLIVCVLLSVAVMAMLAFPGERGRECPCAEGSP